MFTELYHVNIEEPNGRGASPHRRDVVELNGASSLCLWRDYYCKYRCSASNPIEGKIEMTKLLSESL
jgi:hypothetical protein